MNQFRRLSLFFCLTFAMCAASAAAMPDLSRGRIIAADEIAGAETLIAEGLIAKADHNDKMTNM